jgi:hypothetical protein
MSLEHNPARCDRGAYSIARFCEAHDLARGTLYKLWKLGLGPRYFKAGNRTLIGVESAAEWRATMEQITAKRDKTAYPEDKAEDFLRQGRA